MRERVVAAALLLALVAGVAVLASEDMARVLSVNETLRVPFGSYVQVVDP